MTLHTLQLADISGLCPSEEEVWKYFEEDVIPVITKWQLEKSPVESSVPTSMDTGSGCEVVNSFLSGMVTHFELEGVEVHQVNIFYVIFSIGINSGQPRCNELR